jgi:hypothetical protein
VRLVTPVRHSMQSQSSRDATAGHTTCEDLHIADCHN